MTKIDLGQRGDSKLLQLLQSIWFRLSWRYTLAPGLAFLSIASAVALNGAFKDTTYIGNETPPGAPVVQITLSAEEQSVLNQKVRLAEEYAKVQQGTYDLSTFEQESSDFLTSIGEDPYLHRGMDRTNLCPPGSATATSCIDPNEFTDPPANLTPSWMSDPPEQDQKQP
jgi:hypothetical protein